jgi:hypothetical protein
MVTIYGRETSTSTKTEPIVKEHGQGHWSPHPKRDMSQRESSLARANKDSQITWRTCMDWLYLWHHPPPSPVSLTSALDLFLTFRFSLCKTKPDLRDPSAGSGITSRKQEVLVFPLWERVAESLLMRFWGCLPLQLRMKSKGLIVNLL